MVLLVKSDRREQASARIAVAAVVHAGDDDRATRLAIVVEIGFDLAVGDTDASLAWS
jgi:hypothetical protein